MMEEHLESESSVVGNSGLISEVNTRLVLQSVRVMQPTYRAAVARQTGLNPATVTGIVTELLARGIVEPVESPDEVSDADESTARPALVDAESRGEPRSRSRRGGRGTRGGRPPEMLRLNADAQSILAIDLEPDCIRVAVTNMLAEPVEVRERISNRHADSASICRWIQELADEVIEASPRRPLLGVGVCLPGLIDADAGVAVSSTNMPNWRNVPIREMVSRRYHAPVRMGRSFHLAAMHELWLHPELEVKRVALLSLRTGVGATLVDRGEIYTGRHGYAGEIGHTVIDVNGDACECGGRGCLETFVSASAVRSRAERLIAQGRGKVMQGLLDQGEPLRPELIYRLAKAGDTDCQAIVRDVARYLGIAAANLLNLFAPDVLVIGGSIDTADEVTLSQVRRVVECQALPRSREAVQIRLATAGAHAALLGAAVLIARQAFELPKLRGVGGVPFAVAGSVETLSQ